MQYTAQWAKSPKKNCSLKALKIQCYIVKNTLLQNAFSAILPTGSTHSRMGPKIRFLFLFFKLKLFASYIYIYVFHLHFMNLRSIWE